MSQQVSSSSSFDDFDLDFLSEVDKIVESSSSQSYNRSPAKSLNNSVNSNLNTNGFGSFLHNANNNLSRGVMGASVSRPQTKKNNIVPAPPSLTKNLPPKQIPKNSRINNGTSNRSQNQINNAISNVNNNSQNEYLSQDFSRPHHNLNSQNTNVNSNQQNQNKISTPNRNPNSSQSYSQNSIQNRNQSGSQNYNQNNTQNRNQGQNCNQNNQNFSTNSQNSQQNVNYQNNSSLSQNSQNGTTTPNRNGYNPNQNNQNFSTNSQNSQQNVNYQNNSNLNQNSQNGTTTPNKNGYNPNTPNRNGYNPNQNNQNFSTNSQSSQQNVNYQKNQNTTNSNTQNFKYPSRLGQTPNPTSISNVPQNVVPQKNSNFTGNYSPQNSNQNMNHSIQNRNISPANMNQSYQQNNNNNNSNVQNNQSVSSQNSQRPRQNFSLQNQDVVDLTLDDSNNNNNHQNVGPNSVKIPLCNCKIYAIEKTSGKENENKGRKFWVCSNNSCKFFEWGPLVNNNINSSSPIRNNISNKPNHVSPSVQNTLKSLGTPTMPVSIELQLVAKDIFYAGIPANITIETIFKNIPGSIKDEDGWKFPLSIYNDFVSSFRGVRNIRLNELSSTVVKVCTQQIRMTNHNINFQPERLPHELIEFLMGFQYEGVQFGVKNNGRVLIGDEMGLGKTIQAISLALYYKTEWPLLIICPSSLRLPWADSISQWVGDEHVNVVMSGKSGLDSQINIISYELCSKLEKEIIGIGFKVIICDESHFLKNPATKRAKTICPLLKNATRCILLSGTPAISKPLEIWSQLNSLASFIFHDKHEFGIRYCGGFQGRFGWDFTGASNLTELHILLENTVMIRRLKKDVLNQLPDKTREKIQVSILPKLKRKITKIIEDLQAARDLSKQETSSRLQDSDWDARHKMTELFRNSGTAKLPSITSYMEDLLESNCKFLIFGHHKEVIDGISHYLDKKKIDYIRIDGRTPMAQRNDSVKYFQENTHCRVAVLSITAAGQGLTLTAANLVIFAEMYWNPGQLFQCEDRAHRIGQESNVTIQYLIAKGTVDEYIWNVIAKKSGVIGNTLDGDENAQVQHRNLQNHVEISTDVIDDFLKTILERVDNYEDTQQYYDNKRLNRQLLVEEIQREEEGNNKSKRKIQETFNENQQNVPNKERKLSNEPLSLDCYKKKENTILVSMDEDDEDDEDDIDSLLAPVPKTAANFQKIDAFKSFARKK